MITKQEIKYIRSLHQKKVRDQEKVYLAEGIKIVEELLQQHPKDINFLVCNSLSIKTIYKDLVPDTFKIIETSPSDFNRISTQSSPQGVMAIVKQRKHRLPEFLPKKSLSLLLDCVQDPGNLGTIIRVADWFGIENIFCSEDSVECYNPKVVQASMGSILRIAIHYNPLSEILKKYKKQTTVYSTTLQGENLYAAKLTTPALLILGNESKGISKDLVNKSNKSLLIPNYSNSRCKSESLNVSMAAGIVCAEFCRQNG